MECNEKLNIHQINKLDVNDLTRKDIFPITVTSAVFDKQGNSLEAILLQNNSIFLSYKGSSEATRVTVPLKMRRKGLIISYKDYDGKAITEKLVYDDTVADDIFKLDSSWTSIGDVIISGEISISPNGTWIIDGKDSGIEAVGPKGDNGLSPIVRATNNKLEYSYDGTEWTVISDYIAAWFRFENNKIQISRDNKKTWEDLSDSFTRNLYIKGYVATVSALPTNATQGDIYMVGPQTTGGTDYLMYIKDSTGWKNNGSFTSIAAGVVQELGDSETEVISQKVITEEFTKDRHIIYPTTGIMGNPIPDYNHLANYNGTGEFTGYIENENYDCVWINIYEGSKNLTITGATPLRIGHFSSLVPSNDTLLGKGTVIPEGTKISLITFAKSENLGGYSNLKIMQEGMPISSKTVNETIIGLNEKVRDFLPDRSFSGKTNIDYNHLCGISSDGNFTEYTENPLYDTAWILIFKDTGDLKISGVTITRVIYFSSLIPDVSSFISHTVSTVTTIPSGAKLALVTLKKSDNLDGYLEMIADQQGAGVSKMELISERHSFLPDRSFSNYPNIDYNHLWNLSSSGTSSYIENSDFDTAWVQIYDDSGILNISGVIITRVIYFSALRPNDSVYIGTGTTIPSGAKLALITLRKSDNPDGYLNMNVKQNGSGITRKELDNKIPQFIQKVIGKNLINPDDLLYGWTYSASSGLIQSDDGILSNKMILSPGTLTVQGIQPYSGNQSVERILLFNDKDELISAPAINLTNGKGTFTVTCSTTFFDVVYCRLVLQYDKTVLFNKDIAQFEYGNEATDFEACKTKLVVNPIYEREQRMCFLTGASSSVPANGYFENACRLLGYKHRNVAVSGENVMQHANKAWKGILYTPEELEEIDIFITSHIHNYNIAYTNPDSTILHDTVEEYEQNVYDINGNKLDAVPNPNDPDQYILPTQGYASQGYYPQRDDVNEKYAAGYDYLLKKYIKDCYELRNNPNSKYYGTVQGKPVIIVMCTQWHDGYVVYNNAVKEVASRFGAVVCDFASNVGFSYKQTNPDDPNSIRQSSLLCTNRLYGSGNDFQDIYINGVLYTNMGWHPTRDINSYFSLKRGNILADVLKKITF